MIVVAHTATGEDAVVVALQYTGVAGLAVPRARRRQALARGAQSPSALGPGRAHRHHASAGAGLAQHRVREVTHNVQHNEITQDEV